MEPNHHRELCAPDLEFLCERMPLWYTYNAKKPTRMVHSSEIRQLLPRASQKNKRVLLFNIVISKTMTPRTRKYK